MYQERPATLPGAVVWRRSSENRETYRVLPDGCLDLIWTGRSLFVAGPDTTAHLTETQPGDWFVGLRFAPGTGGAALGVPAYVLRDARVPLSAIWPEPRVRRLAERLAAARRPGAELERAGAPGLADADPAAAAIVAALRAGTPVAAAADQVGLSDRQLRRRSSAAFGYPPKVLARVLRMERALALARAGAPLATVAAVAGYADQAHLAREIRALTGASLTDLRS
jgi:AraC-like DNA-binding protein